MSAPVSLLDHAEALEHLGRALAELLATVAAVDEAGAQPDTGKAGAATPAHKEDPEDVATEDLEPILHHGHR